MWFACCCKPKTTCGNCENSTAPKYWDIAVAGVSDDLCQDCSRFNKTHTLADLGFCQWETAQDAQACDSTSTISTSEVFMNISKVFNERFISVAFRVSTGNETSSCGGTTPCQVARYELVEDDTDTGYDASCVREFTLPKVSSFSNPSMVSNTLCNPNCFASDPCSGFPSEITLVPGSGA